MTTDTLREHTMPIKQEPRSPLESDLRPADADQLKDIYQRDQKLAEMRSRAQVDPSTRIEKGPGLGRAAGAGAAELRGGGF